MTVRLDGKNRDIDPVRVTERLALDAYDSMSVTPTQAKAKMAAADRMCELMQTPLTDFKAEVVKGARLNGYGVDNLFRLSGKIGDDDVSYTAEYDGKGIYNFGPPAHSEMGMLLKQTYLQKQAAAFCETFGIENQSFYDFKTDDANQHSDDMNAYREFVKSQHFRTVGNFDYKTYEKRYMFDYLDKDGSVLTYGFSDLDSMCQRLDEIMDEGDVMLGSMESLNNPDGLYMSVREMAELAAKDKDNPMAEVYAYLADDVGAGRLTEVREPALRTAINEAYHVADNRYLCRTDRLMMSRKVLQYTSPELFTKENDNNRIMYDVVNDSHGRCKVRGAAMIDGKARDVSFSKKFGSYEFNDDDIQTLLRGDEIDIKNFRTRGGDVMDIRGKLGESRFMGKPYIGFVRTDGMERRRLPDVPCEDTNDMSREME